jgi:NADPH2:quinone reductase
MGSGLKGVPLPKLIDAVKNVFQAAGPAKLQIAIQTMPLSEIQVAGRRLANRVS